MSVATDYQTNSGMNVADTQALWARERANGSSASSMPTYQAPTINYGASGVTPAGGMDLTNLTNYINTLNRTGQTQANNARIPGNPALEATSSGNIGSELAGKVNPDVMRLLQQQAAERGVATGSPGSPNSDAAYLQALGLTSVGIQQQGQRDLTAADARNPAAPLFDPTTQLMTPYQSNSLQQQKQAEADRMAMEQQRLALEARGGGGGGGGGGGRMPGGGGGGYAADPTTRTYGGTAADLAGTFATNPTQSWWNSIGFTPGQGAPAGGGSYSIGNDVIDPSLFDNMPGGGAPAGTVSGPDSSSYDPFASVGYDTNQLYGGG